MIKKLIPVVLYFWTIALGLPGTASAGNQSSDDSASSRGCTVITVSKGDSVFFGGNDDYINPDSWYWVGPGTQGRFGVIWFGTPDNPQQGINEKGLAYDANGLPRSGVNPHPERLPAGAEYHHFCMQILHECATVEEVIHWVNTHRHLPYMHDQMHFADSSGDAVIISAGADGEPAFTRKAPGDGFLVSTNFNLANPSNGYGYPCRRFETASDLLGKLVSSEGSFSATDLTRVMDAVHQEQGGSWTIATIIADLKNLRVYVYYFYQYDRPVILDVKAELAEPREPGPLSMLFPDDVRKEAARRYEHLTAAMRINKSVGLVWPVIVLVNLVLLFAFSPEFRRGRRFWIPAALLLGPLASLSFWLSGQNRSRSVNRDALTEATGDLAPMMVSFTLAVTILVVGALSGGMSWQVQLLVILVLPLLCNLILQGAMLAAFAKEGKTGLIVRRIPQVVITTFTGLGGVIPVALPLVNKTLAIPLLVPLTAYPVLTWWAIMALGAIPAGIIIFIYERWAARKGFITWTAVVGGLTETSTPGWKAAWRWIPVSIGILVAGLIAGAALAK